MGGRKHNERFRGRDELTVYGRRSVIEALMEESVEVIAVAASRQIPKGFKEELFEACGARGVEPQGKSIAEINELSGDARQDQGVAARIRLGNVTDIDEFVGHVRTLPAKASMRLMALDGVTNPQNVGMIVRSAVASGMDAMLWPTQGSPWVSGLIIKASAASVYRCQIVRTPTLSDGLTALHAAGLRLCGLAMEGGKDLFVTKPHARAVYVVGHETEGISNEVDALLEERVTIPMQGGIESLNAAVAASVMCFWATRT